MSIERKISHAKIYRVRPREGLILHNCSFKKVTTRYLKGEWFFEYLIFNKEDTTLYNFYFEDEVPWSVSVPISQEVGKLINSVQSSNLKHCVLN